jgi:hypothetical protein
MRAFSFRTCCHASRNCPAVNGFTRLAPIRPRRSIEESHGLALSVIARTGIAPPAVSSNLRPPECASRSTIAKRSSPQPSITISMASRHPQSSTSSPVDADSCRAAISTAESSVTRSATPCLVFNFERWSICGGTMAHAFRIISTYFAIFTPGGRCRAVEWNRLPHGFRGHTPSAPIADRVRSKRGRSSCW